MQPSEIDTLERPQTFEREIEAAPNVVRMDDRKTKQSQSDEVTCDNVVALLRMPHPDFFDHPDERLITYDRSQMTEGENQARLDDCLQFIDRELDEIDQPCMDLIKMGPSLVHDLGVEWDPGLAAHHLQLNEVNEELSRAFYAALFASVNTAPVKTDWSTVVLALATFVHALPEYRQIANAGEHQKPFGPNTAWLLAKLPWFENDEV